MKNADFPKQNPQANSRTMKFRHFRDDDSTALAAVFHASVCEIGIRDYSEKQVAAWSAVRPTTDSFLARAYDGRTVLVAESDVGEPVAYVDLERDGHIDHLYCRPDHVGTGVASALYDFLEKLAKERGIVSLYVEASEAARRLFERKGFVVAERLDFEIGGVRIHNYLMMKTLISQTDAIDGRDRRFERQ